MSYQEYSELLACLFKKDKEHSYRPLIIIANGDQLATVFHTPSLSISLCTIHKISNRLEFTLQLMSN